MKTNKTKVVNLFKKARSKSDIKPILQGINIVENKNKENWIACTDTFRLHAMKYILIQGTTQMPFGTYNLDTLELIDEIYPNYENIFHREKEVFDDTPHKLKEHLESQGIKDLKQKTIMIFDHTVAKEYAMDAINFLCEVNKLYNGTFDNVKVYKSKDNNYKPLVICLYAELTLMAYAMVMPRNES